MTSYLKTLVLLGVLSAILVTIGGFIGGSQGLYMAFFFALLMNGAAYFFSEKIALSSSGAKPVDAKKAPELYKMVEELSKEMSIPMPKLYMTPATQANAFATGRSPKHASVAVTQGLMNILSKDEVKAVLAHELSHVKNRDILIASVASVLASAISFIGNMALWGGFGGSDDEDNRGGIIAIIAAILLPISASLIQFAISRQREFGADATGAKAMGTGKPLANALLAINDSAKRAPMHVNPAFSSLYISNPLGGLGGGMLKLFSTHPPVEERVKKLLQI